MHFSAEGLCMALDASVAPAPVVPFGRDAEDMDPLGRKDFPLLWWCGFLLCTRLGGTEGV